MSKEFHLIEKLTTRLLLTLSLALVPQIGCRPSSPSDRPTGYLVVGLESSPTHLDPRYATDANSARIAALIFSSLTRMDEQSRSKPDLAERWEMVDERTYLFHLKKGVTFHNGLPLTATDVKFTYESALDPRNQSPKRGILQVVEAVDQLGPHTIRFRLKAPHAPFLESSMLGIVPQGTPRDPDPTETGLIGSGPFSLERFSPGENVVLRANSTYWEGQPSVPGLVFKIIPDAMIRVLEFKKGGGDFLQNDIEPDMLPWLKSNTNASILTRQGTIYQYVGINLEHPILRHLEVRQALAYAIDREAIIRHLLKGLGTPATGLLSPLHWAYEPSVLRFT